MSEFKPIPGLEDYGISVDGRVKNLISKRMLSWVIHRKGYAKVSIQNKKYSIRRNFFVHRLVLMTYQPTDDLSQTVDHIDGNKLNNHVDNLRWCTIGENIRFSVANRVMNPSERNGRIKLNEGSIYAIRHLSEHYGVSDAELGAAFKVTPSNISSLLNGETWKAVGE